MLADVLSRIIFLLTLNCQNMSNNKQQTIIQKLISIFEISYDANDFWEYFNNNQNQLLEQEKQQIKDAFGYAFGVSCFQTGTTDEEYYSQTFKND